MNLISKIIKLLGTQNVPHEPMENELVLRSDRERMKLLLYFMNTIVAILLLCLLIVLAFFWLGSLKLESLFMFAFSVFIAFFILVVIRISMGDTVVVNDRGFKEINWLYSKAIPWGNISSIYRYQSGDYRQISQFRKLIYKVKSPINNISIYSDYANIVKLHQIVNDKASDKLIERKRHSSFGIVLLIAFIIFTFFRIAQYLIKYLGH